MNEVEVWKFIPGYENLYLISTLGNVKRRDFMIERKKNGVYRTRNYKAMDNVPQCILKNGYKYVSLYYDGVLKNCRVNVLMAKTFLAEDYQRLIVESPIYYVIDHLNNNKLDNRIENLQIITNRENVTKSKSYENSERPTGVCKKGSGYQSRIRFEGVNYYLGTFKTETEASQAYQLALSQINAGIFEPPKRKRKRIKTKKIIINPKIAS